MAVGIGILGGMAADGLLLLIRGITDLAFFHRLSTAPLDVASTRFSPLVILVPVAGGVIVGIMARWGSSAIRGHGIPEVMDAVLHHDSRIPPRLTILKPLSAAIAIGTGGPFGAEGPIIATGGALGSLLGQVTSVTADERKTLLAAGAAAGMAATFGTPVAAVLLAVELLLFEYRARSIIPVAMASCAAAAARLVLIGTAPVFPMPGVTEPGGTALAAYAVLGALIGAVAAGVTYAVYFVEDGFERLPVHWMWWPAIGGVVVGVAGWIDPRIFGVGYPNITAALSGQLTVASIAMLVVLKFIAWVFSLGSGTSGGTLAPLFTFGSGLGALIGFAAASAAPSLGIAPPVAALVGMAAMFAGASRALLASVVFAFETTRQPLGLLPLLAGCSMAYYVSRLLSRHSIMTMKLARRGVLIQEDYSVDYLRRIPVRQAMTAQVTALAAAEPVDAVRRRIASGEFGKHQGFPVIDQNDQLVGIITMRDISAAPASATVGSLVHRAAVTIHPDQSLRDAADLMVRNGVGRLPVVSRDGSHRMIGIITRSDLLRAHAPRLYAAEERRLALDLGALEWWKGGGPS